MDNQVFKNISKIIERDAKTATYKFALLRGVIDIIQDNSPYIKIKDDIVEIPLGLLIEKWLIYYYPILESEVDIPQINGKNLAFQSEFKIIISSYSSKGGLSFFYDDLRIKDISNEVNSEFYKLVLAIKKTITTMPMKYIGGSVFQKHYSIFNYTSGTLKNDKKQNSLWLVNGCGTFTVPRDYYEAFKILGSFISGTDNILFKWAEFSVNASGKVLTTGRIVTEILKFPVTERDVEASKKLYTEFLAKQGSVSCVWSGSNISKYDIDHMLPFSIYKNNDLWNLLPSSPSTNSAKLDKIPSLNLITKQKELIIHYWEVINQYQTERFMNELQISLLGNNTKNNWQQSAFSQLLQTSKYLIETRGYPEWQY
ncbi:MAG TPA: HNH endonuclease domain-containing protein [Saprospiraceae bacterium]|nr:HNH endonuclease domain-containing protein [Saprospiraceae bacterium]HMU02082.1 HNH endonuclease domain-containing protein [Saprospiraceae bacterium]